MTKPGKENYERLTELLAEVACLQQAGGVLHWDQQTHMPPAGAQARANHMAAMSKVIHEKFTAPEIGKLLESLREEEASLPYDTDEASTIRVTRREYERAIKLPPELVVRLSRAQSEAYSRWLEAREAKDFHVFRPALEPLVAIMIESAETLGYEEHPMDALLDRSEPGVRVSHLGPLFAELRAGLVPLVQAISSSLDAVDDRVLHQAFDRDTQMKAGREAVEAIGFDLTKTGRLDFSVHPFSTSFSPNDVRITTRIQDDFFNASFFACLHEAGHGSYMRGIPLKFERSILGDGASSGLHESQSRLWENLVGRSRAFWEFFYPRLNELFPSQLAGVPMEAFYRAVNKVEPSLIRVEADEVTYNLHIMIRFELEKAVFDGKLGLKDMPEAWAAKFQDYLGLTPPDHLVGPLQDIHWTFVFGAGFPGYTIGNVASVQLYQEARKEYPDIEARIARGEFADLLGWMNRNVHAHAAKFTPQELLERVTGRPLTAAPYLAYIKDKFSDIYGL
jgi:carboxypeptidase Taq